MYGGKGVKSKVLCGAMLCVALFAASPALATIVAFLETPDNMQAVSGITRVAAGRFLPWGGP